MGGGPEVVTLSDAFRVLTSARNEADEQSFDAAQVIVYQELHVLSRRLQASPEERQESGSRCFERLLRGGPRSILLVDGVVQAYLWMMLKNHDLDRKRRERRELPSVEEPTEGGSATEPSNKRTPETLSIEREQAQQDHELVSWGLRFVFGELKELLTSRLPARYRDGFKDSVDQLRSLVLETETLDGIVMRECREVTATTRNRIYQRHCRAREQYLDWLEDEMPSGNFSSVQQLALKGVVGRLRR
jgi:DNA-directed RNA polymerase specialized sigma24 family protein